MTDAKKIDTIVEHVGVIAFFASIKMSHNESVKIMKKAHRFFPLRLTAMVNGGDHGLNSDHVVYDVLGILKNFNLTTGKFDNNFLPLFLA